MLNKTKLLLIIFLLILVSPVYGQTEKPNTFLTLVDAVTKEPISDAYIKLNINGNFSTYYLEKDENLKLSLTPGDHFIKILVDSPKTKGADYYGETYFSVEGNLIKVVYLYPGGSLGGFIKDKLENVISGASLRFDCNKVISIDYPLQADHFGSFSLDYVPIGKCKIYGSYQESMGFAEIEIKQGEKNSVEIKLDKVLVQTKNRSYLSWGLVVLVVVVLATLVLFFIFRRKISVLSRKEKQEEKEIKKLKKESGEKMVPSELGSRGQDILKTLRVNEKTIIEFLLGQKEAVYLSQIHHKTGLSKGSLFRNLDSLEKKNIVQTFKEGKVRKVKLSEWFLEK